MSKKIVISLIIFNKKISFLEQNASLFDFKDRNNFTNNRDGFSQQRMIEMKSMIFSGTKLTDNKQKIEKTKEKISCFFVIFTMICRIFKVNMTQRKQSGKVSNDFPLFDLPENKNSNKMLRFLALLMRVLRLYKKLSFQ